MTILGRRVYTTRPALLLFLTLACPGIALGQGKTSLRVCSDPENMPFSNQKLEGFENRIASLIAKELGTTVSYIWWGQRRGFIRNTMNATLQEGRCDVVIGVPEGYDLVSTTVYPEVTTRLAMTIDGARDIREVNPRATLDDDNAVVSAIVNGILARADPWI